MSEFSISALKAPEQSQDAPAIDFEPLAGSVIVLAYDNIGEVAGVAIEARELRNDKGGLSRGALACVTQGEHRTHNSFIGRDELPELIKAFDALLAVNNNPTKFENFEVKYKTREDFEVVAFNGRSGISYVVRSGSAQVFLKAQQLRRVNEMLTMVVRK